MARKILTSSRVPKEGNFNYYHLPKGMLDFTLLSWKFEGKQMFEVEVKERHIPDPDHRYFLHYHANPYTNDKIEIEFYPLGYLKRLSATIEDKSLAVIDQLLQVSEEAAKAIVGVRSMEQKEVVYKATVDPFDEVDMERVNEDLKKLNTGLSVKIASMHKKKDTQDKYEAPRDHDNGIYCRPVTPYLWIVGAGEMEQREIVMLPHPDIIHYIHLPSTRFVTNEFLVEFDELGYPIKINLGKPSQALQIMEIPLKILRSIVRIPAELFQFRIDYRTQRQNMLEAEQKLNEKIDTLSRSHNALKEEVINAKK